ncbi:hypothetical protein JOB18_037518 [Solea senegalensis]|uniref:Uncharacterized protein n=1 Tax=Solea senegalensis TaxID=28829 RepID=A0AAV6PXC2_SOLSE|nr:hypothetical protein JOB18_037518 [Solea senegalensis]
MGRFNELSTSARDKVKLFQCAGARRPRAYGKRCIPTVPRIWEIPTEIFTIPELRQPPLTTALTSNRWPEISSGILVMLFSLLFIFRSHESEKRFGQQNKAEKLLLVSLSRGGQTSKLKVNADRKRRTARRKNLVPGWEEFLCAWNILGHQVNLSRSQICECSFMLYELYEISCGYEHFVTNDS